MRYKSLIVCVGMICLAPATPAFADPPTLTPERAAALVEQLGNADYRTRATATVELITVGPAAIEVLRRATRSDDFEAALRAKSLLAVFEQLLFVGTTLELSASKESVAWDESFQVMLRIQNRSEYPARVPFEKPADRGAQRDELRQVTSILDLAEHLVVTGPDGEELNLFVEDLADEQDIFAAVSARAEEGLESTLPAATHTDHVVESFNRGMARYRMLQRGDYRLQLVYQPQWDDPEMVAAGIGRRTSNVVTITVKNAPPDGVGSGRQAMLTVEPAGDVFRAVLTSVWDLPIWVNTNFERGPRGASLRWVVTRGDAWKDVELPVPGASVDGFACARIVKLEPGEKRVLAECPRTALPPKDAFENTVSADFAVWASFVSLGAVEPLREALAERKESDADCPFPRDPHRRNLIRGTLFAEPVPVGTSP